MMLLVRVGHVVVLEGMSELRIPRGPYRDSVGIVEKLHTTLHFSSKETCSASIYSGRLYPERFAPSTHLCVSLDVLYRPVRVVSNSRKCRK